MLITDCVSVVLVAQGGSTALHWAAWKNSLEVAEVLVAANANMHIKNKVRASCSWLGCWSLISVSVVLVGQDGDTALHDAKQFNHQEMVTLLSSQL